MGTRLFKGILSYLWRRISEEAFWKWSPLLYLVYIVGLAEFKAHLGFLVPNTRAKTVRLKGKTHTELSVGSGALLSSLGRMQCCLYSWAWNKTEVSRVCTHMCGNGWDDIWADQLKDISSLDTGWWHGSMMLVEETAKGAESGHWLYL